MHEQSSKVTKQIMIAMIAGLILGLILHSTGKAEWVVFLKPIGVIFIRLLKMVIVPLVFSSIFMAMINLGSPEQLGDMGKKAVGYYFLTTALAVLFGLIVVNVIQPGVGMDLSTMSVQKLTGMIAERVDTAKEAGLFTTLMKVMVDAIPKNPIEAMANTTILQVIVFSILFGITALYMPKQSEPVVNLMGSIEAMILKLTHGIMLMAPIGIFALMTDVMASAGFTAIVSLTKYIVAVLLGLTVHAGVLLFIASARLKKSPLFVIKGVGPALLTALSTSSSAATLPITMANVEDNLGVSNKTAKFVLPLGATINMDGTALYESVAAIFIAQAYGIDLTIQNQIVIFLTASLAAIGAAAIPGAGLVTMSIVLSAVGLPIEGIGLILAVDRILDMFRTTVNVFGDCVGTVVVDSFTPKGTPTT